MNLIRSAIPYASGMDPFRVFYLLTGTTFFAFATGFSSCLFDVSQVKECVDYAEHATALLQKLGDHIIVWFIALVNEVLSRYPSPFN
ncbi:MAG: hypothetical protein JO089_08410 [Alphaproteobacteria bacterium]|nr:hypothetical protein [Alphaproteobacteria bacterium]